MLLKANSLVEQALDPSQAQIPDESLWAVFAAALAVTLAGLFCLWLVIRRLGRPGGSMHPTDLYVGFPVAVGAVMVYLTLIGWLWTLSPLLAGTVQSLLALGCIFFVAYNPRRARDLPMPEWVSLEPRALGMSAFVWLLAVPVLIAAMFAAVALAQMTGLPVTMQEPIERLRANDTPLWIAGWYVAAGVGAPLLEEFVFRLVIFGGLLGLTKPLSDTEGWRHPGTWIALAVSGFLFVMAHGVWEWTVGIIPLSTLTFVLTAVYMHTRSIWPSVLVHAIHNCFVVTMQFFVLMD